MARAPRRSLFWQVYPILLGSVALVAILGAIAWHLLGPAMMGEGARMRMHALRAYGPQMIVFMLAVAALIAFAAYPVMARTTRRLEELRRDVDAWGGGNLARRASDAGGDEVAAVAASFNAAADRVDALLAAHKALLAHASHELRSPLARLSLATEMFVDRGEGAAAGAMRREIAELDALVDEILLASRLDLGAEIETAERVDCLALAAEEAARVSVSLRDVAPGGPAYEVLGSPRLLRRLIRNLLENALKHGRPPVEIALEHASGGGRPQIVIRVTDHGQGIPPALGERVFEPFFRPQGSSEEGGSWGLGLSLVRQIAMRTGGRAMCKATVEGLTALVVELPALDGLAETP
jgi:two-component system OmpR family sensor kinase